MTAIVQEEGIIEYDCEHNGGARAGSKFFWDIEDYPRRIIMNPANDLFKYLSLFAHVRDNEPSNIRWEFCVLKKYACLCKPYAQRIKVDEVW
jgi:hypothetical protein